MADVFRDRRVLVTGGLGFLGSHVASALLEAGARRTELPHTERACDEVTSLPFFPAMPDGAVQRVCAALEAWA